MGIPRGVTKADVAADLLPEFWTTRDGKILRLHDRGTDPPPNENLDVARVVAKRKFAVAYDDQ
jgi:hypothetical protein